MDVLAHRQRCGRAPSVASDSQRTVPCSSLKCSYAIFELAMPALPSSPVRRSRSTDVAAAWMRSSSILSTLVSTRLTKKLATLATLRRSPPAARRSSIPPWNASTTSS